MGSDKTTQAPNSAASYQQGIDVLLKNLPRMLGAEQDARFQYDPIRIAEQQGLQSAFGPTQYQQQLDALKQLDPHGVAVRDSLGSMVEGDLKNGGLPNDPALLAELNKQWETSARAHGVASGGSTIGPAAESAENLFKGQNLLALRQNTMDNAGNFLGLSTPEQQALAISPVSPDRTSAYVDPNAGFQGQQFAMNNFQNLLAQQQASGGSNSWSRALSGAASGAALGYSAGGGWGALIGAGLGAGAGGWG